MTAEMEISIILMNFSSLAALEVANLTTSGDNFVQMTFPFHFPSVSVL